MTTTDSNIATIPEVLDFIGDALRMHLPDWLSLRIGHDDVTIQLLGAEELEKWQRWLGAPEPTTRDYEYHKEPWREWRTKVEWCGRSIALVRCAVRTEVSA